MITLEIAQEQLNYWLEASRKSALGQKVEISSGSSTRRVDRAEALEQIEYWNKKCISLGRGSSISVQRLIIDD